MNRIKTPPPMTNRGPVKRMASGGYLNDGGLTARVSSNGIPEANQQADAIIKAMAQQQIFVSVKQINAAQGKQVQVVDRSRPTR